MKVLHIFNEIKYSGAEIMYANAAFLFQKEGIELTAIATGNAIGDFEPQFAYNNIKVFHYRMPNPKNFIRYLSYVHKMVLFVKENNFDLIHIHRSDVKWVFALIAKLSGINSVYTVHNVFRHRKSTWIKGLLDRYTARKFFGQAFQTIGHSVYENELEYYKTPSIRVNNWFDGKKFFPTKSEDEKKLIRQRLGIPLDAFVLISTGGCSHVKNHHAIIEAISMLSNKENVIYLHLGSGKTEHEEKELVKKLGITNHVSFLGNKVNVRDYLVASDVYIMPSKFEGLSIASIEAMACGVPSILYNSPGLRDLIHDDDNGLLIDNDATILSQSIDRVINNPAEFKQKALKAIEYVNKEFAMEANVKKIVKLYYNQINK